MRITVFGATGRTGRYFLAEGLRRDHQLTAFTRWPAALVGCRHSRPSRGVLVIIHALTGRDDVPPMSHVRPRPAS